MGVKRTTETMVFITTKLTNGWGLVRDSMDVVGGFCVMRRIKGRLVRHHMYPGRGKVNAIFLAPFLEGDSQGG